jgi:hypothetical protein
VQVNSRLRPSFLEMVSGDREGGAELWVAVFLIIVRVIVLVVLWLGHGDQHLDLLALVLLSDFEREVLWDLLNLLTHGKNHIVNNLTLLP